MKSRSYASLDVASQEHHLSSLRTALFPGVMLICLGLAGATAVNGEESQMESAASLWTNSTGRKIGSGVLWAANKDTGMVCLMITSGRDRRRSLHHISELSDDCRKVVEPVDPASLPGGSGFPQNAELLDVGLRPGMSLREVIVALESHRFGRPVVNSGTSTAGIARNATVEKRGGHVPASSLPTSTRALRAERTDQRGTSREALIEIEVHFVEDVRRSPAIPVAYKLEYRKRFKHLPMDLARNAFKDSALKCFGTPLNDLADASWKYTDQPRPDGISSEQVAISSAPFAKQTIHPPARTIEVTPGNGVIWTDNSLLMPIVEARAAMIRNAMDSTDAVPPPAHITSSASRPQTPAPAPAASLKAQIVSIPGPLPEASSEESERMWETRDGTFKGTLWAANQATGLIVIRPADSKKGYVVLQKSQLAEVDVAFVESVAKDRLPARDGLPLKFDLLDITPGLTSLEVRTILKKRGFRLDFDDAPDCRTQMASVTAAREGRKLAAAPSQRIIRRITGFLTESSGQPDECSYEITVKFIEDVTGAPGESRAYLVALKKRLSPRSRSAEGQAGRDEFFGQVRQKFGTPPTNEIGAWIYSDTNQGISKYSNFSDDMPSPGNLQHAPREATFEKRLVAEWSGSSGCVTLMDGRLFVEHRAHIHRLLSSLVPAPVLPRATRL